LSSAPSWASGTPVSRTQVNASAAITTTSMAVCLKKSASAFVRVTTVRRAAANGRIRSTSCEVSGQCAMSRMCVAQGRFAKLSTVYRNAPAGLASVATRKSGAAVSCVA